jgi:hypothetical protein
VNAWWSWGVSLYIFLRVYLREMETRSSLQRKGKLIRNIAEVDSLFDQGVEDANNAACETP